MNRQLSTSHPCWAPYIFIAPFVLIFCTFIVYPLVQSVVLAMQQTFGPQVGADNLFYGASYWVQIR